VHSDLLDEELLFRALEDSAAARVGDAGVDRLGKSDKLRHTVTVA